MPMKIVRLLLAALGASLGLLLLAPVLLLGLPFWLIGATTRALARVLEPRHDGGRAFVEFDPVLGWRPRPNARGHHYVDDVFYATTDEHGWRRSANLAESQIVVLGDSFAWGYGIDDRHFFANLVPGLRVKTIGIMGYNMVQELLWLERLSGQLEGKLVAWFVYLGNDLFDNLVPHKQGYTMPFVRRADDTGTWEIVTSHVRPSRWLYTGGYGAVYYETLTRYCTPTAQPRREYAACEALLGRGKQVCAAAGARLVVVTIPDKTQLSLAGHRVLLARGGDPERFDPDLPDREIGAICDRLGIPFVAGKQHLDASDYKERDVHWNVRGHRRVAQMLAGLYQHHAAAELGIRGAVIAGGPTGERAAGRRPQASGVG